MVTQGHHDVTCKDEKEVEEEEEELQQAKPLERVRKRKKKGRRETNIKILLCPEKLIFTFWPSTNPPPPASPCHLPPEAHTLPASKDSPARSHTRHANLFHHFKNIHLYVCL